MSKNILPIIKKFKYHNIKIINMYSDNKVYKIESISYPSFSHV